MKYILLVAVLFSQLPAEPSLEWGNMIGDNPDVPAAFRHDDKRPYDFLAIVKLTADSLQDIDSARVTLTADEAMGFLFPAEETDTRTTMDIKKGTAQYMYWNIIPPAKESTYINAVTAIGTYYMGGSRHDLPALQREITVKRTLQTSSLGIYNNGLGCLLTGKKIELKQRID